MKNLMGEEALGLTTIMVALIIPIYNTLAVVTLEVFRGGTRHVSTILKRIITNPMILGAGSRSDRGGFPVAASGDPGNPHEPGVVCGIYDCADDHGSYISLWKYPGKQ